MCRSNVGFSARENDHIIIAISVLSVWIVHARRWSHITRDVYNIIVVRTYNETKLGENLWWKR